MINSFRYWPRKISSSQNVLQGHPLSSATASFLGSEKTSVSFREFLSCIVPVTCCSEVARIFPSPPRFDAHNVVRTSRRCPFDKTRKTTIYSAVLIGNRLWRTDGRTDRRTDDGRLRTMPPGNSQCRRVVGRLGLTIGKVWQLILINDKRACTFMINWEMYTRRDQSNFTVPRTLTSAKAAVRFF